MGCGLNKLEKRDDRRPGNIYSTLKRPQVETKIDVSYEYRFLEFTTLSAAELPRSSAARLASLRDLPSQLRELYQQGFLLVALHPFVQPAHKREKTPLEHIFRAILIKKTNRSQKSDLHSEGYSLEVDCCSSLVHLTDQKIIPEFIKQIQEAAGRGLKFIGVIPQYRCPQVDAGGAGAQTEPGGGDGEKNPGAPAGVDGGPETHQHPRGDTPVAEPPGLPLEEGLGAEFSETMDEPLRDPSEGREEALSGKMEIFALFNRPKSHQECQQYYPVTIPLRVSTNDQTVSSLDASWLEHMSDHFRKGGVLVNAIFYLGLVNDSLHSLTDGVFIFEAVSTEDSKTRQGYDAIVVEQWTVLEFQWRFSREDMHGRQARKSKGKLSARDKRQAEENEKNLEDQSSKARDVSNCVLSRQLEDRAPEETKATGEQLCPDGRLCEEGEAVQNGPAGHCGALAGGCEGPSGPGEDAREGGAEEEAAETAGDN
ncbi:raftlin isoform X2 [Saccopteryx bilineata]|uniref:raftlin isoform X2 n=1 Tax=Saccopteryx bilineata TaxID=59482 RepID=UPI00338F6FEE